MQGSCRDGGLRGKNLRVLDSLHQGFMDAIHSKIVGAVWQALPTLLPIILLEPMQACLRLRLVLKLLCLQGRLFIPCAWNAGWAHECSCACEPCHRTQRDEAATSLQDLWTSMISPRVSDAQRRSQARV